MKHVQESLIQFQDRKAIHALVEGYDFPKKGEKKDEKKEDKKEDPNSKKKPNVKEAGSDKTVDKGAKESVRDTKTILNLVSQNFEKFKTATKGDIKCYAQFFKMQKAFNDKLGGKGKGYKFFGSCEKGKVLPGDFAVMAGKAGIVILSLDKDDFEGETKVLTIENPDSATQFNELLNKITADGKAAKEEYKTTTHQKKKEEVFKKMAASGKKPAAPKKGGDFFEKGGANGSSDEEDKEGETNESFKRRRFLKKKSINETFEEDVFNSLLHMGYSETEADFMIGELDGIYPDEDLDPADVADILVQEVMGKLKG